MRKLFVMFGFLLAAPHYAFAGTEGHAGDELRLLFDEGRTHAIQQIAPIKRCSFSSSTPEKVQDWILANKYMLMDDIENSLHDWITDNQATCAYTQITSKAPITLSFVKCENIVSKDRAGRLLIHESVHHFGISDQSFADAVAMAIYTAEAKTSCPDPSTDPFEPLSCLGSPMSEAEAVKYISPGDIESGVIGKITLHARSRVCHAQTGCGNWRLEPEYNEMGFLHPVTACTDCGSDPRVGYENFNEFRSIVDYNFNFRVGLSGRIILDMEKTFNYGSSGSSYRYSGSFLNYSSEISAGYFYNSSFGTSGILTLGSVSKSNLGYSSRFDSVTYTHKDYIVQFKGKLTDHCLRLAGTNKLALPDGRWVENQGVLFSQF